MTTPDPRSTAEAAYRQLRAAAKQCMRRGRRGALLQTTMLANEAWLRLRPTRHGPHVAPALAASALRSVLVDAARREGAAKRGRGWRRVSIDMAASSPAGDPGIDLLDLDEALVALERTSPRAARIVELRYFAGLDVQGVALLLGVCPRTVEREFQLARAILRAQFEPA